MESGKLCADGEYAPFHGAPRFPREHTGAGARFSRALRHRQSECGILGGTANQGPEPLAVPASSGSRALSNAAAGV